MTGAGRQDADHLVKCIFHDLAMQAEALRLDERDRVQQRTRASQPCLHEARAARAMYRRDAKGGLDGPGTDERVWSLPRQTTAPARRAMMSRAGAAANGERAAAPSPLVMALLS